MPLQAYDKNFKKVTAGSAEAAFLFKPDDPRLPKLQAAAKTRAGTPAAQVPAETEAEETSSVERVGTARRGQGR